MRTQNVPMPHANGASPDSGSEKTEQTSQSQVDYSWAAPILERPIDADRNIRVICVGAGFSGIGSAIHLREHVRDVEIQVYEAADDIGGVWHLNRYAGVACDIPSHSYQFSFCQNTQWSKFYAPGEEIQNYLKKVVGHYQLQRFIKLRHKVIGATWSQENGKWAVAVENLETGEKIVDEADFILYATGLLSKPKWPFIPGRETYKGLLHHSAGWDAAREEKQDGFSWENKRVAVIGAGSSGIQIMPYMQKKAKHVTNFVRSRTWITATFASEFMEKFDCPKGASNHTFTAQEKERFKDENYYQQVRHELDQWLSSAHKLSLQNQPLQLEVRKALELAMREKLEASPEIAEKLIPDFPVSCKRLTPGPGYLECLLAENVDFCSQEIARFTERGLMTVDGCEYEFDSIICATGFDVSSVPAFPIRGLNGVNLQDLWAKEPKQYLGLCVPQMPNFFPLLGAQTAVSTGSLLLVMEQQIAYATKCIQKCIREGYKSIVVKDSAVESFLKYADNYFDRTVYNANCRSWYKNGASGKARIRTLWPGSSQHAYTALRHPRWEDFDYERLGIYDHPMAWLGDGDVRPDLDRAFYLEELRAMHKDHPIFY
ncbi:FAD/NAD(P)-binding domain-containing protein [Colletotrichum caudatum]|nr:FAD/NAD(P)-binding domain-containing protein [Colletotrichum caudatum]